MECGEGEDGIVDAVVEVMDIGYWILEQDRRGGERRKLRDNSPAMRSQERD